MKVHTNPSGWYPDDINSRLNFDEFHDETSNDFLFVGYGCFSDKKLIDFCRQDTQHRKVYINLEHPCSLYDETPGRGIVQQLLFDEVYTICPYSAEWFNSVQDETKFMSMPYPHNLDYDIYHSKNIEKVYDVAYNGIIHSEEIASFIKAIANHKYFFSTITQWNRLHDVDEYATHNNIPNIEKWNILAQSRMAVIQNNLHIHPHQVNYAKSSPQWEKNKAFSSVDSLILPQFKSRTVESAICKSLMLVKSDEWNVMEHWFEPNEDFIYFDNADDLNDKITEIKNNWDSYSHIPENAYKKVIEKYNTKYIFEKIKNGEEIK
tara:strand:- start:1323 stop:2282 length:960 start_codon:yes stop_codon:yes gene_type:complete